MNISDLQNKRVGIAVLGGGLRASAYLGIFKALKEAGVNITALIGSSGGSIITASIAFGKTDSEILRHSRNFTPLGIFNPIRLLFKRKIDYWSWEKYVKKIFPENVHIQDSPIKLAFRAIDLDQGYSSTYIESGAVYKGIVACSAFLNPYEYQGHKYVDGDFDPRTSVDKLKQLGAEKTILVYAPANLDTPVIANVMATQLNAIDSDIMLHTPDYIIKVQLKPGFMLSKQYIDLDYQTGYQVGKDFVLNLNRHE